jgi:predicted nucleic acid-binding protein
MTPVAGPFLFDTSAEAWFARPRDRAAIEWMQRYVAAHPFSVSAIGVIERIRGYSLLWLAAEAAERARIDASRIAYLQGLDQIFALDSATALVAADIMALVPVAPTPPRRSHRLAESRQDRLARWRFDCIVAATAVVAGLPLAHNNPLDFEAIRSAIRDHHDHFRRYKPLSLVHCSSLL